MAVTKQDTALLRRASAAMGRQMIGTDWFIVDALEWCASKIGGFGVRRKGLSETWHAGWLAFDITDERLDHVLAKAVVEISENWMNGRR